MPGATYTPGQVPVLPGIYFAVGQLGEQKPVLATGIVAALFSASWGPPTGITLDSADQGTKAFGTGQGTDIMREAFRGGAVQVRALRVGTGGTKATKVLNDSAAAASVTLTAAYVGTRGLKVSLTDNPTNPTTQRDLKVYTTETSGDVLRQTITFAKGVGEPAALVAAIAAQNQYAAASDTYVTSVLTAAGTGLLATVATPVAMTGGADPTVDGAAYTAAFATIAGDVWNVATIESVNTAIQASAVQWIKDLEAAGSRRMLVIGEPTTVPQATRFANAAAFNSWRVVYAANGFTRVLNAPYLGVTVEGAYAAAALAGDIAFHNYRDKISGKVLPFTADTYGGTDAPGETQAIQKGAVVFHGSGGSYPLYPDTTYVTLDGMHSAAWKKITTVLRMDLLMDRIALVWDLLLNGDPGLNNTPNGRAALVMAALAELKDMERTDLLQAGGNVYEDSANPPSGDTASFIIEAQVADQLERVLAQFHFG